MLRTLLEVTVDTAYRELDSKISIESQTSKITTRRMFLHSKAADGTSRMRARGVKEKGLRKGCTEGRKLTCRPAFELRVCACCLEAAAFASLDFDFPPWPLGGIIDLFRLSYGLGFEDE